ncbi:MAG: GNAT family N-acetyltransferase [Verrucomicrobiales bacterium]|nr:GNAT family N-acetyltransferase [Verrucomicrobiales bacterium]
MQFHPHNVQIREATLSDSDVIVEFNTRLATETEDHNLDREILTAGVGALLEDSSRGQYFVAESPEGEVIGQLMFTFEWSDWRNGQFWWLQSVYVRPDSRKHGVFSALLAHVTELAERDPDVCGIRLYVEKENIAAQSTYRARGFIQPNYEVMENEFPNRA